MSIFPGSERVAQGPRLCAGFLPSAGCAGKGTPGRGDGDTSLPGCPGLTAMLFPPLLVPWLCSPRDAVFQAAAANLGPTQGFFAPPGVCRVPHGSWGWLRAPSAPLGGGGPATQGQSRTSTSSPQAATLVFPEPNLRPRVPRPGFCLPGMCSNGNSPPYSTGRPQPWLRSSRSARWRDFPRGCE